MRRLYMKSIFVVAFALLNASLVAQDDASKEHEEMQQEHRAAMKDHLEWTNKLHKMRAEHRRALAALAKLRAEILEHEAEIEEVIRQIKVHDLEMRMHDMEIHDHEEKGDDSEHKQLNRSISRFMPNTRN